LPESYANKVKKQICFQIMIFLKELILNQIDSLFHTLSNILRGEIMLSAWLRIIMKIAKIAF